LIVARVLDFNPAAKARALIVVFPQNGAFKLHETSFMIFDDTARSTCAQMNRLILAELILIFPAKAGVHDAR